MNFWEVLNNIWGAIAPYLAGISFSGILSAVIYGCLRGAFNKALSKLDKQKIADEATDKVVEHVKEITFKHSIQPIVESELEKIDKNAAKEFRKELDEVQESYEKLRACIEKLASYFDNSFGVSEQAKAELHKALDDAKIAPTAPESVESAVVIETAPKAENKGKKSSESAPKETTAKVVR